ncbi:MAG: AAA family ATPase [Prevotellaceae bacterium]|jgi:SpoVK/Ycf46/Vps4 family AAA+-type ATPase|nr:AAA family ATPase [Prevotellaceae bacterium]
MEDIFSNIKEMIKANFPLLYLTTSEYSRVTQKIRTIAYGLDCDFHTWDCVDGLQTHKRNQNNKLEKIEDHPANGETQDYLGFLEYIRKGLIRQNDEKQEIFLVEDFHKYFDQEQVIVSLRKLSVELKSCNKHLIFLSPFKKLPEEIEKYLTVVNMPLPDRKDLQTRLKVIAGIETAINPDLEKYIIDSALGLTDTEADLAFRLAKEKVGLDKKEAIQIIANEKEQIIKKSGILDYFQVNMDLEKSVGGLDNLKLWLKQRSKSFERKAKDFGLKEPKGILLLGVPGCGKSLTAKCVATEWKQPLLRLDIGKVFQAEVGSSENNIRQAIATAEAVAPCVLWIDEIEKGLSVGGGEKDGGTNSRVFSTILTWMQEKTKPVFVVATANNISNLPPELLRKGRFDEIFFVDLPTKEERANIFKIHLGKYNQTSILNFEILANKSKFFNGAEIEESVKEAMFLSYVENPDNQQISLKHLEKAIEQIVPLSQTMKRKIDGLREWASTRARLASKKGNDENIVDRESTEDNEVKQTKREREEDIF